MWWPGLSSVGALAAGQGTPPELWSLQMANEGGLGSCVGAEGAGGSEQALPHPASRTGVVQGTVSSTTRAEPSLISPSVTPGSSLLRRLVLPAGAQCCFATGTTSWAGCHQNGVWEMLLARPGSTLLSIICSTLGVNWGRSDPSRSVTTPP